MYISQAFKSLHEWWRYLVGLIIAIIGVFIFSVPHLIAIGIEVFRGKFDQSKMDDTNYIMSFFDPNLNLIFVLLPFVGGLLFLLFLSVRLLHKQTITQLTTTRMKIDWKRFWFIFILWGVISSSLVLIDYFASPDHYIVNFQWQPFLILCIIAILFIPLQTSFEEYLFRGYLMQGIGISSIHKNFPLILIYSITCILVYIWLNSIYSFNFLISLSIFVFFICLMYLIVSQKKVLLKITESPLYKVLYKLFRRNSTPLIITSFVFGMLHIANPEVDKLGNVIMVYYIGTGLFLGIMTLMDGGIELSLGFHAANNLFTALLVTADWTAFQTHSILKDMSDPTEAGFVDIFMPVFIVFPIILLILAKKYKWTDWREKLFGKVVEPQDEN